MSLAGLPDAPPRERTGRVSTPLPGGVHLIDTGFHRPNFDASYLIVDQGRAAFVDTGTTHSVPRLLRALREAGVKPEAVDWLIVTHVHLDHAGGAGRLMQALPGARLVVHPLGARHMIDPRDLVGSATKVYGAEVMARTYGEILPIDGARVLRTRDGMTLKLGGRTLEFIDTPGHARHHHCIWDGATRGFFTGDTFGISYREFDTAAGPFAMPATTPVQFEPESMRASIRRMLAYEPEWLYLTHYGRVGGTARLGVMMLEQIDAMVALGHGSPAGAGPSRQAALEQGLGELLLQRLRAHGCTLPRAEVLDLLALDIELDAQGLGVWLDRQRAGRGKAP